MSDSKGGVGASDWDDLVNVENIVKLCIDDADTPDQAAADHDSDFDRFYKPVLI